MYVTAIFMEQNIWMPLIIGLILISATIVIVTGLWLMEGPSEADDAPERVLVDDQSNALAQRAPSQHTSAASPTSKLQNMEDPLSWRPKIKEIYRVLRTPWKVRLLILSFLVSSALPESEEIFLQYVSIKLGWTISEASSLE